MRTEINMRASPRLLLLLILVLSLGLWVWRPWAETRRQFFLNEAIASPAALGAYTDSSATFVAEVVADKLTLPWDLASPSEAEILVTEKAGSLWRVNRASGERTPVTGVPQVKVQGQGGLHAVILHPKFSENGLIYLSYAAAPEDGKGATTHFMRAKLSGSALSGQTVLLRAEAPASRGQHFGGAMVFDRDGYLFVSVGDRGERDDAQKLSSHNGKILRLHDDGSVPKDNPFVNTPGALPEIWSYGHRNPQGLALDPVSGRIYEAEHGPQGGDEINVIERGRNYGWPVITYGREYGTGIRIGEGTTRADIAPPLHYYVPSIATAGIAYYAGDAFPQWKNSLFVAALRGHLNRVQLNPDGTFGKEERLLADRDLRIRAVRVSPNGELFVVADDGVILRVSARP
jgi:glucose/arabinose dehydrogenase